MIFISLPDHYNEQTSRELGMKWHQVCITPPFIDVETPLYLAILTPLHNSVLWHFTPQMLHTAAIDASFYPVEKNKVRCLSFVVKLTCSAISGPHSFTLESAVSFVPSPSVTAAAACRAKRSLARQSPKVRSRAARDDALGTQPGPSITGALRHARI